MINNFSLSSLTRWVAVVISAVLISLGSNNFMGLFIAFMGYALFWRALFSWPQKKNIIVSFCWFLMICSTRLFWMTSLRYQPIAILLVYALLCLAMSGQFAFVTFLLFRKDNCRILRLLAIASIWTILEWSRLFVLCGFTFNPVGQVLTYHHIPMQLATIFGIFGLSFWVIFTNLLGYRSFRFFSYKNCCLWVAMACVPYIFGFLHVYYQDHYAHEEKNLAVILIQTGLMVEEKEPVLQKAASFISPIQQWHNIFSYIEEKQAKNIDLIVLPESALPFGKYHPIYPYPIVQKVLKQIIGNHYTQFLPSIEARQEEDIRLTNTYFAQVLANRYDADVIIGLDDREKEAYYNAAFLIQPYKNTVQRYEKQILVPIVEYFPTKWAQKIAAFFDIHGEFVHGKTAKVFDSVVSVSPSICYEETFGHHMRQGRKRGAQVFVNLTNDVWFPASSLPQEHFALAKLRTVENGIPLLRACNTGVTAAVDCLGRTLQEIHQETEKTALLVRFPLRTYSTIYTKLGDHLIMGFCGIFIVISAMGRRKKQ